MREICANENLAIADEVIRELLIICKGDMRKSVNML